MFFDRFCFGLDLALSLSRIYVHKMRLKCCAVIVKSCKERKRDAVRKIIGRNLDIFLYVRNIVIKMFN